MLVPNQRGKKQADRVCNGVAIVGASASVRIGIATSADQNRRSMDDSTDERNEDDRFIHAICSVLRPTPSACSRACTSRVSNVFTGQGTLCCSPKRLMAPFNACQSPCGGCGRDPLAACSHSARQSVYQFLERSVLCRPPACPSRGTRIAAATAYNSSTISRIVWRVCSVSSRPP